MPVARLETKLQLGRKVCRTVEDEVEEVRRHAVDGVTHSGAASEEAATLHKTARWQGLDSTLAIS